jgi:hypothetical protein
MHINKALDKVDELTEYELRHFVQLIDVEIDTYRRVIANYPQDRIEKYGVSYLAKLKQRRDVFAAELSKR